MNSNKIILTESSIFKEQINATGISIKDMLSFALDKNNYLDIEKDFQIEMTLIKTKNFMLMGQILSAIKTGRIIFSYDKEALAKNVRPSIIFTPICSRDSNGVAIVDRVIVNVTSMIKLVATTNDKGDIINKVVFKDTGKFEAFYDLLFVAYVTLNTNNLLNNNECITTIRDNYLEAMSYLLSQTNGVPIDGTKCRYILSNFFYGGRLGYREVAMVTKYSTELADTLHEKYDDFFIEKGSVSNEISLAKLCEVLNGEFPNFNPKASVQTMVAGGMKTFSPNGCYLIDNIPTLISIIAYKSRRSSKEYFRGMGLNRIEKDSSMNMSKILQGIR